MPDADDFSPIADQGELPRSAGLRSRFSRRAELAPVESGFVRVFIDEHGNAVGGSDGRSAGERYWANGQTWVAVDVGDHTLEFPFPVSDPTGRIGFIATLTVNVAVTDSIEVARRRIGGVRRFVEPKLNQAVRAAVGKTSSPGGGDPISLHTLTRHKMEEALGALVGAEIPGLPSWLTAEVASFSVAFDEETDRHLKELRGRSRSLDIQDADALSDQHTAMHDIRRRQIWREYLAGFLTDPSMRMFEAVFADPSAENIERLVREVDVNEHRDRLELVGRLQDLVRDDALAVHDDGQRIAIESIVSGLEKRQFSLGARQLETSKPEEIPEATVTSDSGAEDDRNWTGTAG